MNIANVIKLLNSYSGAVTVISVIVGGFWTILKFKEYLKDKRFKTYHELIDELVNEQRQPDRHIKLDRQIAIVYELRNYSNYYPVSKRILNGVRKDWESTNSRILEEIDLTLEFINSNWFLKKLMKFRNK